MARRKSIKVEIEYTIEDLARTLKELENDYPACDYDIEVKRMTLNKGTDWWYIEVWKL